MADYNLTHTGAELDAAVAKVPLLDSLQANAVQYKRELTASDDLDMITETGWYHNRQSAYATDASHYPRSGRAGRLSIWQEGAQTYQQYQEYYAPTTSTYESGKLWWRGRSNTSGWGPWRCASEEGHTHAMATASTSGFMTADMYNNVIAALRFMRVLTASDNLNDITASGIYHNPGNSIATEANNYPRVGVAGMLIVHKYGNMVYQIYQAYNDTSAGKMGNWMAWRGCYSGVWGSWFFAATTDTAMQYKRTLVAADDLDAITESGWYHNASNANATADKHYPRADAAGRLSVWANGNMVYQQYQEVRTGSASGSPPLNKLWWRCCYGGTWGAWDCASIEGHVHTASTVPYTPPSGMSATNVQAAISEVFQSASDFKASVAAAVTGKGVQTAANANKATMVANIGQIGGAGSKLTVDISGQSAYVNSNLGFTPKGAIVEDTAADRLICCSASNRQTWGASVNDIAWSKSSPLTANGIDWSFGRTVAAGVITIWGE